MCDLCSKSGWKIAQVSLPSARSRFLLERNSAGRPEHSAPLELGKEGFLCVWQKKRDAHRNMQIHANDEVQVEQRAAD